MTIINSNLYFIGLFLFILLLTGNLVAETFGCTIQKLFHKNQYVKHIAILFLIYFTVNLDILNFENKNSNKFLSTFIIWILFILFTKSTLIFTIINFILITIMYIVYDKKYKLITNNKINLKNNANILTNLNNYTKLEDNNEKLDINYENDLKNLNNYINWLSIILTIFLIIGFYNYLIQQKSIYKKKFNIITFIIGNSSCSSFKMHK